MVVRTKSAVVLAPKLTAKGGAERVALAVAKGLREAGYGVTIMAPGEVPISSDIGTYLGVNISGIEIVSLPTIAGLNSLEALRSLIEERMWVRAIKGSGPEVFVNCLYGATPVIPGVASYLYVHFPHSTEAVPASGIRHLYLATTERLRRALNGGSDFRSGYDVFLANSEFTSRHIRKRWKVEPQVLYPPCPITAQPSYEQRSNHILSVGRFQDFVPGHPHKSHDQMIAAFKEMRAAQADGWQLHLAGSVGSSREVARLRDLAAGYDVRFHLDASAEKLRSLYRDASIYWHAQGYGSDEASSPEAQEHFGIAVVEAMSAGLIPIVYGEGGPAEIVSGVDGSAKWHTLPELIEVTERTRLRDNSTLALARRCARIRAESFSETIFMDAFLELLKDSR